MAARTPTCQIDVTESTESDDDGGCGSNDCADYCEAVAGGGDCPARLKQSKTNSGGDEEDNDKDHFFFW